MLMKFQSVLHKAHNIFTEDECLNNDECTLFNTCHARSYPFLTFITIHIYHCATKSRNKNSKPVCRNILCSSHKNGSRFVPPTRLNRVSYPTGIFPSTKNRTQETCNRFPLIVSIVLRLVSFFFFFFTLLKGFP